MTDASTVTMKTLSNTKGVALIILIIAMTLISLLGASMVSIMGAKQRGFVYQMDSYRALNLANAGVEYAIRLISDEASTTSGNFFQNPSGTISRSFENGSFTANYTYASDLLSVSGSYGNSTKQIKLTNFRRYIDPLTLVYDPTYANRTPYTSPYWYFDFSGGAGGPIIIWTTRMFIPIFNNSGSNIVISRIDIVIPLSGRYLRDIYFLDTAYQQVYDYESDGRFALCGPATCKDPSSGIRLASGGSVVPFPFNSTYITYTLATDTIRWCVLQFDWNSTFSSSTQYQIIFYYTLAGTSRTSTIKFTL